jgi:ABC-type sugar transport system ATPase subunit
LARVTLERVGKDAPSPKGPVRILGEVSLEVAEGELLVLVGPSGCGKTTLLRCIAGLETIDRGTLAFDGARMNDVPPRERDVAMVFQSYALYPHLTVRGNLAFGLEMRRTPAAEIARRVDEAAAMLGIGGLLDRLPRQLSGGQRQRVAMGRAVVRRPRLFLFDEPLSNLDAALRGQMRVELKRLHARLGATMIYVTHDQVEAMTLADRIALLRGGALVQVGTPAQLYARPSTLFAARFFGTPEMNAIVGALDGGRFRAPGVDAPVAAHASASACTLGVRAEDVLLGQGAGEPHAAAVVEVVEDLGWESLVHLAVVGSEAAALVARVDSTRAPRPGERVALRFAPERLHLFTPPGERLA